MLVSAEYALDKSKETHENVYNIGKAVVYPYWRVIPTRFRHQDGIPSRMTTRESWVTTDTRRRSVEIEHVNEVGLGTGVDCVGRKFLFGAVAL